MLGGRCAACSERNPLVLTLNHINGYEGTNPKVRSRGGWSLYMKILSGEEGTDKCDLRCCNCQIMYEFQRGKILAKIKDEVTNAIVKAGIRLAWAGTQSQRAES